MSEYPIIIKANDYKNLSKFCESNEEIEIVNNFLKENKKTFIEIKDNDDRDGRSGWSSRTYILKDYCSFKSYSNEFYKIVSFIKEKDLIDLAKEQIKSDEYKKYLELQEKYKRTNYYIETYKEYINKQLRK